MISTFTPALCIPLFLTMLFLLAHPRPLVSTGSGYLRPLLEETIDGIIIITLPSDIHGNNIRVRSVFFRGRKKKTDKQTDFIVNPGHKIATKTAILRNPNLSIDFAPKLTD
jgi:hypothetical protein